MEKKVLITGAKGFIGKNLAIKLKELNNYELFLIDQDDQTELLNKYLSKADVIFHLAGVNRPKENELFSKINTGLTESIILYLKDNNLKPQIVFSSSIQSTLDNPYGISKRNAEKLLMEYSKQTGCPLKIYRLANVFGKWCRPNYNSVVATFCYNISNELPIKINNPLSELNLIYIDDIINEFISCIEGEKSSFKDYNYINPVFIITLKMLAEKIYSFKEMRQNLILPDFNDLFTKYLYTTYLSYLPNNDLKYQINTICDERGSLTELIKSMNIGQIFVSTTKPGITRGNHYHHTKVEKFCIVKGKGKIDLRRIDSGEISTYHVNGDNIEIVDIPPGYTHSITNIGNEELVVLFWANEIFSKDKPDTQYLKV